MRRFLIALALVLCSGCGAGGAAGALTLGAKVRDYGAIGARVGCRSIDRASRAAGGPWVVPRTEAEIAEDRAAGLFGELGFRGPDAGAPDAGTPDADAAE